MDDEQDDFKVKVSMADYEILKQAKLHKQVNPLVFAHEDNGMEQLMAFNEKIRINNEAGDKAFF